MSITRLIRGRHMTCTRLLRSSTRLGTRASGRATAARSRPSSEGAPTSTCGVTSCAWPGECAGSKRRCGSSCRQRARPRCRCWFRLHLLAPIIHVHAGHRRLPEGLTHGLTVVRKPSDVSLIHPYQTLASLDLKLISHRLLKSFPLSSVNMHSPISLSFLPLYLPFAGLAIANRLLSSSSSVCW